MIIEIIPNIFKFDVVLPENPLKNLNCYVIKGNERNLIIDTGFNREECFESLSRGIEELKLDIEVTDIFVTHLHGDHSGLVPRIASKNSRIYMNPADKKILDDLIAQSSDYWDKFEDIFKSEGFSEEEIILSRKTNPARKFVPGSIFDTVPVEDGSSLKYGNYELMAIETPGHTPGHTCLYCPSEKLMFCGDHVIFGITPNITMWMGFENSLGRYIKSLDKIKEYDVKLALSGHREMTGDFQGRLEELKEHHKNRLWEVYSIVAENPGLDGYSIASRMNWSIRAKSWADFPVPQKWFALGETISHLDYLIEENKIHRESRNGKNSYCTLKDIF